MRGMRPGNPSWEGEGRTWCDVYTLYECLSLGERMVKVCTICVSYVFMYAVKCVMICVKCSAYVCVYIRTTVVCGCLSLCSVHRERMWCDVYTLCEFLFLCGVCT